MYQTMAAATTKGARISSCLGRFLADICSGMSPDVILPPRDALFAGGANVVQARFPDASTQTVSGYVSDYEGALLL